MQHASTDSALEEDEPPGSSHKHKEHKDRKAHKDEKHGDHKQHESDHEGRGRLKQFVKRKMLRSTSLEPPTEMLRDAGPPMRMLSAAVTKMDLGEAVQRVGDRKSVV